MSNLVINTSLSNVAVPAIAESITAKYNSGQILNQLITLPPTEQYTSPIGFSALAITPSAPVQLVGIQGSNLTYIDQTVNQLTVIDDTVDGFSITNNSTTLTVTVRLVYTVYTGSTPPPVTNVVTSFNARTGAVILELVDITSAGGAPLLSPNLQGVPTAPTPNTGDDSSRIATTEFVMNAVGSGSQGLIQVFEYIATLGQISYPASFASIATVEVFYNGVALLSTDYNTNGVGPVVIGTPAAAGDEIKIVVTTPIG